MPVSPLDRVSDVFLARINFRNVIQFPDLACRGAIALARISRQLPGVAHPFGMGVPLGFVAGEAPSLHVTAACHIFNPELAAEIRDTVANIPQRLEVPISTDRGDNRAPIAQYLPELEWRRRSRANCSKSGP
jgi:hypothetical protein